MMGDPIVVWLAVGAALVVFEAMTAPGLGLFLAGLGALCTALTIKAGVIGEEATAAQFAWFFGFTTLWAGGLWKPLQKFRAARTPRKGPVENHSDIVGQTAVVAKGGLTRGKTGQVAWSGTLMSAAVDDASPQDVLPEGTTVHIRSVTGNTLSVSPVSPADRSPS